MFNGEALRRGASKGPGSTAVGRGGSAECRGSRSQAGFLSVASCRDHIAFLYCISRYVAAQRIKRCFMASPTEFTMVNVHQQHLFSLQFGFTDKRSLNIIENELKTSIDCTQLFSDDKPLSSLMKKGK